MWLTLKRGTARLLALRSNVDVIDPDRSGSGRTALVLQAAWTLLDEAPTRSLPGLAAEEVRAGLSGPARIRLSMLEPGDPEVAILRDQLIERIVGQAGPLGALQLAERVHLSRMSCARVPVVVAAGCLSWYGSHRSARNPGAEPVNEIVRLTEQWMVDGTSRPSVKSHMRELAVAGIGDHSADLVDMDV